MTFVTGGVPHSGPQHVATAEFSKFAGILSAALSQHNLLGFAIAHRGDMGADREWVSRAGRAPQNPRTWERTWLPGTEKARLRTAERKCPPRGREFYAAQEVQRGQ